MARMTYFRKILKRDLFKQITFLRTFLSAKDVLASVAAEDYRWRDRIWTPMRTLWTAMGYFGCKGLVPARWISVRVSVWARMIGSLHGVGQKHVPGQSRRRPSPLCLRP